MDIDQMTQKLWSGHIYLSYFFKLNLLHFIYDQQGVT